VQNVFFNLEDEWVKKARLKNKLRTHEVWTFRSLNTLARMKRIKSKYSAPKNVIPHRH